MVMPHGDFRKLSSISIRTRERWDEMGKEFHVSEMITVQHNWSHQQIHVLRMGKILEIYI
jgi:hypothetical protein